jgi:hypothetical protein
MRNIVCLALHSTQFRSLRFPPCRKASELLRKPFDLSSSPQQVNLERLFSLSDGGRIAG